MSKTVSKFALAASVSLAFAFTILTSCASNPQAQQTTATAPAYQSVQAEPSSPQQVTYPQTAAIDELDISIRDASDYLNEKIPKGSKIVILNIQSNSSDLSDYIIDELIANAVNDGFFTVVDRQQLDAIRAEQNFQLSGSVDDKDALAIGKLFGAKTIVSGAVNRLGTTGYRIRIRALEVQTAQVQGQYNRNIASSNTINSLMESGGTASSGYVTGTTTRATPPGTQVATPSNKPVATPTIQGTMVPGSSITEKLAWLQRSAESHGIYIIEAKANENIAPHTFEYKGAINVTIVLRGDDVNRTIRLSSNGTMFTVPSNVTFILDNNITLHGHSGNNHHIVNVKGGKFKMNFGSTITGNTGGGVNMMGGGTFEMTSGTISGNTAEVGAGVRINGGKFAMNNGIISGNTADWGGGVDVTNGTFSMNGGTISGNIATNAGGGVGINTFQTFTMTGGTITGNTANKYGGGGVNVGRGNFTKTGGTITGYNSDQKNGNVVMDEGGNVLARKGHAVSARDNERRKETTTGPGENLSYDRGTAAGAWD